MTTTGGGFAEDPAVVDTTYPRLTPAQIASFFGVRVPGLIEVAGGKVQGRCPRCRRDGFAADTATGAWACAACGDGGPDVVMLAMALNGEDYEKARAEIALLAERSEAMNSAPDPNDAGQLVDSRPAETKSAHAEQMTPRAAGPPPKPTILTPDVSKIPAELRNQRAWVGWKLVWRNKGWKKEPINILTGGLAETDNPATWVDFQTAVANYKRLGCDGIGLCLTDGWIGIDQDGVLDDDGELLDFPWISPILDVVKGRAHIEYSPSGIGIRAICRGKLPPGRREYDEPGHTHVGFGLYDGNRYLTITGAVLPESGPIEDLTAELAKLHAELFPPAAPLVNGHAGANCHHAPPVSLADDELLEHARRAANGDKFWRLWNGEWQGGDYPTQSEADQALCHLLAFWTAKDAGRMDALFRQSGLVRDKWLDREDYRERTIAKAIEQTSETYDTGRAHTGDPERNYRVNGVYGVPPTDEYAHSSGTEAAGEAGAQANESPHSAGANWPDPLKEEAFYGLAGDCVRMVEPHTEADPAALLIQLLVAFGNLIGRGPYYLVEAIRHFCNLFAVIVGLTSKSRKGTSLGQVQALFGQVDQEWCTGC